MRDDIDWVATFALARAFFNREVRGEDGAPYLEGWEVIHVLHGGDIIAAEVGNGCPRRHQLFPGSVLAFSVQQRWEGEWREREEPTALQRDVSSHETVTLQVRPGGHVPAGC